MVDGRIIICPYVCSSHRMRALDAGFHLLRDIAVKINEIKAMEMSFSGEDRNEPIV